MIKANHQSLLSRMIANLFAGPGESPLKTRKAIQNKVTEQLRSGKSAPLDEPILDKYTEKITLHAYQIAEEDLEGLRKAGYSEAQIFELSAAAALTAGTARLEIVSELLQSIQS